MKYTVSKIIAVLGTHHEEHQPKLSPLFKQILVASGPLMLTVSFGMTSGYSAILLPQLKATNSSVEIGEHESWIASMAALPMAFGCILGAFLMEKLGRKKTQLFTVIPCLLGWSLLAVSRNVPMILTGRFLTGICGGLLGPSTGVYISETSEPRYRDFLLGAIALGIALGLFLVHIIGTFFHWQTTAMISCVFPIVSLVFLSVVPESPSWLAKNKKEEEARRAFVWCRGESEDAKKQFSEIIEKQSGEVPKLSQLMNREFLKPLVVIVVFIMTNQWAGVSALSFYTVSIMKKTLIDGLDEYLAMLIVDLIRMVVSTLTCVIMKNVKRRPLALISGIGTFTSLFVLSGYTHFLDKYPDLGTSWYTAIPMASLVAYIAFISVGLVPLPWAMMGEVFPLSTRNVGSGISSFMAFFAFFSVVKTNPAMFHGLGVDGTFLVYGLVAFLGTVFIWLFLPETKDKTLTEIEEQFKG